MTPFDTLEQAMDEEQFWDRFQAILSQEGFPFFIYLLKQPAQRIYCRTNLPSDTYPGPQDDPFLTYCCSNHEPMFTGPEVADGYTFLEEADRDYIRMASQSEMTVGVGIPVRLKQRESYGGFNIGGRADAASFKAKAEEKLEWLRSLCFFAQLKIEALGFASGQGDDALEALTRREREIFELMASGQSRPDIAERLGISTHTMTSHAKAIYRKLDIRSQAEAIRLAHGRPDAG